jgi:hypothetical protein
VRGKADGQIVSKLLRQKLDSKLKKK